MLRLKQSVKLEILLTTGRWVLKCFKYNIHGQGIGHSNEWYAVLDNEQEVKKKKT